MRRVLLSQFVAIQHDRNTTVTGYVDLWVDAEALLGMLGKKALWSKGKKAQLCSGAVKAVVRKHTITKTVV